MSGLKARTFVTFVSHANVNAVLFVDARGLHNFVCKRAPGRSARHHALDDSLARSFAATGVPVTKELVGISRTDGKRPDGLTLVPWRRGNWLC